ncbi:hypothetical protein BDP81DRAFT_460083 [Colletotrichum phormii]|uniref:Cellulose-binding Sde182 nucleoside hydrolase-like domain-containing protein n=1 Tax=Colletotrichum phormii TaxID=359342 RepID=A0AAI9ZWY7_9PEZI|nr:uncharacterized protein BDP81DRAFT_460083 [Colletotrichum phormii]KAK1638478.1 hypothetical protein BDP81DRAFT_460083 [Colletotrichum phormii]
MFILMDILNEPDDQMSMVLYLTYSNEFDTKGLIATTSVSMPNETHPEAIELIIKAYGEVVSTLNKHVHPNATFSPAEDLLKLVYGRQALEEPLSDGPKLLIKTLQADSEPLFVSIWGRANTLAQALQFIGTERPSSEAAELRSRLRVYSISDQDCGPWIRVKWPDITYIVNVHGFREYQASPWSGIGGAQDDWLTLNIRIGPLGQVYPEILYGMEGDSPSFMWLIQNGLNSAGRPDWGGWGGRYSRVTEAMDINEYGTSMDIAVSVSGLDHQSPGATVWRWRDAYQDDFAARMQWTVTDRFVDATHPPNINVNGSISLDAMEIVLPSTSSVVLDASETYDPDHPENSTHLELEWYAYTEASVAWVSGYLESLIEIRPLLPPSGTDGYLSVNNAGFRNVTIGPRVQITNNVPSISQLEGASWHVIL